MVRVKGVVLYDSVHETHPEATQPLQDDLELVVADDPRVPPDYLCVGTKFLRQYFALRENVNHFHSSELRAIAKRVPDICLTGHYSGGLPDSPSV